MQGLFMCAVSLQSWIIFVPDTMVNISDFSILTSSLLLQGLGEMGSSCIE
jgi:hypothetical protein